MIQAPAVFCQLVQHSLLSKTIRKLSAKAEVGVWETETEKWEEKNSTEFDIYIYIYIKVIKLNIVTYYTHRGLILFHFNMLLCQNNSPNSKKDLFIYFFRLAFNLNLLCF